MSLRTRLRSVRFHAATSRSAARKRSDDSFNSSLASSRESEPLSAISAYLRAAFSTRFSAPIWRCKMLEGTASRGIKMLPPMLVAEHCSRDGSEGGSARRGSTLPSVFLGPALLVDREGFGHCAVHRNLIRVDRTIATEADDLVHRFFPFSRMLRMSASFKTLRMSLSSSLGRFRD